MFSSLYSSVSTTRNIGITIVTSNAAGISVIQPSKSVIIKSKYEHFPFSLPGDLQQKVDPYLRPLYDALFDMLGAESYARLVERGSIEVAPLAYMRGRTLDDSFIILDEAQNTTCEQMKMFLTRLGFNSKMVITGDITQIDLPDGRRSGLKDAMRILRNVDDISVFRFTEKDVVRHRLVQDIIRAYEKASAAK